VGNLGIGTQDKEVLDRLIEEIDPRTGQKRGRCTRVTNLEDTAGADIFGATRPSSGLMDCWRYDIRIGNGDVTREVYLLAGGLLLNFTSPIPNPQDTSILHGGLVLASVSQSRCMAEAKTETKTQNLRHVAVAHREGALTVLVCPPNKQLTDYPAYRAGAGCIPPGWNGAMRVVDVSKIEYIDLTRRKSA
ncbi:MAG: hypothetical protein H6729_08115, partial [Deltaproteobacteria bacterium]|nr:hypothetical protein [Deltaproteobacteria bacterium]